MSFIYILTAVVFAVVITRLKQTRIAEWALLHLNHKSINDDIFDDIIDYDKQTMMCVYLKSSDVYYVGQFVFREEKGIDSWLCLSGYSTVSKDSNEEVYNPERSDLKASVAIPFSNIERIEIFYSDDSKVWWRMNGGRE